MQEFATVLLQRQDNFARNRAADRDLRLAQVASGLIPIEEAFPEEYTAVIEAAEALDLNQEGVDYDYSQVEWESPDKMDPADLADLEEFLRDPQVIVQMPVADAEEWS